jgi:hypothetical protein
MIEDWTTPESLWDVQVLLGFTNFNWRVIRKYAKATTPISDQLKKAATARRSESVKWEWTRDAELAFWKLNRAFTDAPILYHFHLANLIILQTHASGFAIASVHNQNVGFGIQRPVNLFSRKCTSAKLNNGKYD